MYGRRHAEAPLSVDGGRTRIEDHELVGVTGSVRWGATVGRTSALIKNLTTEHGCFCPPQELL